MISDNDLLRHYHFCDDEHLFGRNNDLDEEERIEELRNIWNEGWRFSDGKLVKGYWTELCLYCADEATVEYNNEYHCTDCLLYHTYNDD